MRLAIAILAAVLPIALARAQDAAPLRIGLVEAPAAGALFVARGPDGAAGDLAGHDLAGRGADGGAGGAVRELSA